jgi:hypothetical protein
MDLMWMDSILLMPLKVMLTEGRKMMKASFSGAGMTLYVGFRARYICWSLYLFCLKVALRSSSPSCRLLQSQAKLTLYHHGTFSPFVGRVVVGVGLPSCSWLPCPHLILTLFRSPQVWPRFCLVGSVRASLTSSSFMTYSLPWWWRQQTPLKHQ